MGIHQVDENIKGVGIRRNYLDTGFVVLQRTAEGTSAAGAQDFIYGRDCEYELTLEPGQYVILPQTNGIALSAKGEEGVLVALVNEGVLSEEAECVIDDIFYRFDTMISNSIDIDEFNDLWEQLGNEKHSMAKFEEHVLDKHCSTDRGLTAKGRRSFMLKHFQEVGVEEAKN